MKQFRIVVASLLLLAVTGGLFAFTVRDHSAMVAKKFTVQYSLYVGSTNPPTTAAQIDDASNWGTLTTTQPATQPAGNLYYYVKFDDASTTLQQAIDILAARFTNGLPIVSGTQYNDGAGHSVTLIKRS